MKIFCRKGGRTDRLSSFPSTLFLLAPAWGRRARIARGPLPLPFLLAPPRGGRPTHFPNLGIALPISTHAPAWGATSSAWERRQRKEFLLTPPRGGRPGVRLHRGGATGISTHAPVWGATPFCDKRLRWCRYFYSRPRLGGAHTGAARRRQKPACDCRG